MRTITQKFDPVIATIDLGSGQSFEITPEVLRVSGKTRTASDSTAVRQKTLDRVSRTARQLFESGADVRAVTQAAATFDEIALDDDYIERLIGKSAEWIVEDPTRAYYLLRLTFCFSERRASFWKHALVSSVLGYFLLRTMHRPGEAVPVFEQVESLASTMDCYFGPVERVQALGQLASQGKQEAYRDCESDEKIATARPSLADQAWATILQNLITNGGELFLCSGALARASLLLSERRQQVPPTFPAALVSLAEENISTQGDALACNGVLPTLTATDLLIENGAFEHSLDLLKRIKSRSFSPGPIIDAAITIRTATAYHFLGRDDQAQQALAALSRKDLEALAQTSISAQGLLVDYNLTSAEISWSRWNTSKRRLWRRETLKQLQALEPWSQVPSQDRDDDLRALYFAILKRRVKARITALGSGAPLRRKSYWPFARFE